MKVELKDQNWKGTSINFGLLAGVLMTALLFILSLFGISNGVGITLVGLVVLAPILGYMVKKIYKIDRRNNFRRGIEAGLTLTAVAGLINGVGNFIIYTLQTTYSNNVDPLSTLSIGDLMVLSMGVFIATIVTGIIITFIWLQLFKTKSADNDFSTIE